MFVVEHLATLLFPSGPAHDVNRNHLFVLLTDPSGPARQVLMVPICKHASENCDDTCVITPGQHSFIVHKSFVSYSQARIEPADKVVNGVSKRLFAPKDPVSKELFKRIVGGLKTSSFVKPFAREFFDAHGPRTTRSV